VVSTYVRAFVVTVVLLVAIALEEGLDSAYDTAVYGVFCADCLLAGYLLGWVLIRIPAGSYCLDAVFSPLLGRLLDLRTPPH
jgi:uncharacterized membrane protein